MAPKTKEPIVSSDKPPSGKLQITHKSKWTTWKVASLFTACGIFTLIVSIIYTSSILALIGLGLIFWGALILFLVQQRDFESYTSLMTVPAFEAIDSLLANAKFEGKAVYLPPYPESVYLPPHLERLRRGMIIISKENKPVEQIIKEVFATKLSPSLLCMVPPGISLERIIEEKIETDISKMELTELAETLEKVLVEELALVNECSFQIVGNYIQLNFKNSLDESIARNTEKMRYVHQNIGSPFISAVACALTKVTGKPLIIDQETRERTYSKVTYCLVEV